MKLGEVSEPVQTELGWHLVQLDGDNSSLEELVGQLKLQEKFDEVIAETRQQLYVEVRSASTGF